MQFFLPNEHCMEVCALKIIISMMMMMMMMLMMMMIIIIIIIINTNHIKTTYHTGKSGGILSSCVKKG